MEVSTSRNILIADPSVKRYDFAFIHYSGEYTYVFANEAGEVYIEENDLTRFLLTLIDFT